MGDFGSTFRSPKFNIATCCNGNSNAVHIQALSSLKLDGITSLVADPPVLTPSLGRIHPFAILLIILNLIGF